MNVRTVAFLALGILALIISALILPTPLHNWFVTGSIGPVPADVGVMALIILITPVTILATILSKFNVDFADE